MFHFNKHFNRIIVITSACLIFSAAPIFAGAQPVVDSPANVKLQNIYDRLGSMYSNCMVPQYNILSTYCNYKLSDLNQSILAVGGQVADVSSKLITTNNYLSSIDSKTIDRNYTQYIDQIENYLNTIADDSGSSSYKVFDSNIDTCNYFTSNCNYQVQADGSIKLYNFNGTTPAFIGFANMTLDRNTYYVCKFDITTPVQLTISSLVNGGLMSQHIIPANNPHYSTLVTYTQPLNLNSYTGGVYIINGNLSSSTVIYIKNIKYFVDYNLQALNSLDKNLDKLVDIYASDDVIAAKQNQQAYENQAITDFTGSGNAAASTSDTSNMKNVSGAIKSGLDSGGTVNGALGVFNTSGGLWDWFSQANYNEINGTNTRSRNRSNEVYIDFYNTNREELEELLGEYR